MKFRSHWPSVTPSARLLVRLPLHVILIVEAAFASASAPRKSERMRRNVRCFDICDHNSDGRYYVRILAKRLWPRQYALTAEREGETTKKVRGLRQSRFARQ